ncbi:DUF839 domain-containing protein [Bradyrhizobium diazoefficiens]|nr:alkaline phosphatase PhoX [Bradyrhizobium diazoefficiens]MBR0775249.1 DUF839 domain-containing protein [Bradyrhizobium diazoefficiens]
MENPAGIFIKFGILSDTTRTEPDQNTYLVLEQNPGGPSPGFDYGRHFLFQGHENGGGQAYITRVNLDVNDPNHRITLLTPGNGASTGFSSIDGSTFNPFTKTLLFTQETSSAGNGTGKVIQVTLGWPPVVNTLENFLGLGGYEGIRIDDEGNLYLVEDISGKRPGGLGANNVPLNAAAQPNSFVYRYIPNNKRRIEDGGKLQALQVIIDGAPVKFNEADPKGDILSPAQLKLHTPGSSYPIKWVTIATPAKDSPTSVGSATALAKAAGATPFKRPENMAWLPGSNFRTFFFTPTGDTDAPTSQLPELAARGSWGSIFRVDLRNDGDGDRDDRFKKNDGTISLFFLGDQVHNSFDNINFASHRQMLVAEDRGDTLHDQLNTLDSVWAFDVHDKTPKPLRFIALGRDASASAIGQEDNEPTGVLVSKGSTRKDGQLGTSEALEEHARGFFTQQHGDNVVFEFFRVRDERRAGR